MQKGKYAYRTADSEHCFDLSGLISAVNVTDIYSTPRIPEKEFFACALQPVTTSRKKKLSAQPVCPRKNGDKAGTVSVHTAQKTQ